MQATALTYSLVGLEGHLVRVEVDSGRGVAQFQLVGLPEASVRESRVRVKAALHQVGIELDELVITVNLSPADLKKSGGGYDLAIAVAVLAAVGAIPAEALERTVVVGELSLSGAIRAVRGVLPILCAAQTQGFERAIVPSDNGIEASVLAGLQVRLARHLHDVAAHLKGEMDLPRPVAPPPERKRGAGPDLDLADVRGQLAARRALEVAAAGGHNLLFVGPPGCGKTMLARRLAGILPKLTHEEALEVMAIHSVAGQLHTTGMLEDRPFRAPHHTVSAAGLVGGGEPVRPGEVSLAHHGCLFLDELAEFRRGVLEALRQPLEDGIVTVCRARARAVFPAKPLVVAAVNPCPCGFSPPPGAHLSPGDRRCVCSMDRIRTYRARLSGPLVDRLDLHVALRAVAVADLAGSPEGERSEAVRERASRAREVQLDRKRRGEVTGGANALLGPSDVQRVAAPDAAGAGLIARAADRMFFSARAYDKVLRVARTLADLEGSTGVRGNHVAEAISMRLFDRMTSEATLAAPAV